MSKLPEARIAGVDHRNVLLGGIGLAISIAVAAAMLEANAIGGIIVLALVGGLWLHRRHVVDRREPAPRVEKPLRPVHEQTQRLRAAVVLSITAVVLATWFVATVEVDWSVIGMLAVSAGLMRAFTA